MTTARGKVLRFWNNVPATSETPELTYEPFQEDRPANMEELAKRIEIARAHKIDCDAEALKAEGLLNRCIDEYEQEEVRRGLKSRK